MLNRLLTPTFRRYVRQGFCGAGIAVCMSDGLNQYASYAQAGHWVTACFYLVAGLAAAIAIALTLRLEDKTREQREIAAPVLRERPW